MVILMDIAAEWTFWERGRRILDLNQSSVMTLII
jgi:hypothetical protein